MWLLLHRYDDIHEYEVLINIDLVTRFEKNLFKNGTHIVFDAGNWMDVTETFDEIRDIL